MNKPKIGITVGDINGIGLEVILKTFAIKELLKHCTPIVYGSSKVISYHKNIAGVENIFLSNAKGAERVNDDKINVINCWQDTVNITLGKETEDGGKYAYISLDKATNDLKLGLIDAIVTAPINKKAMQLANFPYPGHTEYLTKELGGSNLMLMVHDTLRVGLVTNHLPLSQVASAITKDQIKKKIKLFNKCLKMDFGIERPIIAVLALNPHASDGGVIGNEEEEIIRPAIITAKKNGVMIVGPFGADGFFGSGQYKKYDGILAMYHDQGLIPFKTLSFGSGVNFTAGLEGVRTSPDHGTAYDIAGKNEADPTSFRKALFLAIDVARNRSTYEESHANPIKIDEKLSKSAKEGAEKDDGVVKE